MPKLEAYRRELEYSYALGLYPCLQLMEACPQRVRRLLLDPRGLGNEGVEKLRALCAARGIREEMAERVLKRESRKDNCYAALVFDKFEATLDAQANHVVLCRVADSGNLGTAMRSMLAFGMRDLALIRPCADVFEPHALRASMGAFTKLRVHTYDSFDAYRAGQPGRSYYPFMLDASEPLARVARRARAPYALLFGNEATGLPPEFAQLGQSVRIPQSAAVDSLNLAVAVAIGCYEFSRGNEKEE